jgi:hypothetical protein
VGTFRHLANGLLCRIVAPHGRDGALVRDERGIVGYALLSELEQIDEQEPQGEPAAGRPDNPKRFDRWTDGDGQQWIFDQPRNTDGSYVSDSPETPSVESALRWYHCGGSEPVAAEDRHPEQEQPKES